MTRRSLASMYLPSHSVVEDEDQVRAFVAAVGSASLVTVGDDGVPDATTLPVLWEGDRVTCHLARNNEQWQRISAGAPGLLVVRGPEGYVSPSWYASKAGHGRVVPTWNYTEVQLRGPVTVHDDPEWVLGMVTRLTEAHERDREQPWAVSDAPDKFVRTRLRAIVGVELTVADVQAKAKLSRDKSEEDQAGVLAGMPPGPLHEVQGSGGLLP